MAKHISIFLLRSYQLFLSPLLSHIVGVKTHCRFDPSCSEYTLRMVKKYGAIKGVRLGLAQLGKCHPFKNAYAAI